MSAESFMDYGQLLTSSKNVNLKPTTRNFNSTTNCRLKRMHKVVGKKSVGL